MNKSLEEIRLFIKESMEYSSGQKRYHLGIRRFLKEKFGKHSPILKVVDLLHHQQRKFKKQASLRSFRFIKEASIREVWKLVVDINKVKNSEEFRIRRFDDALAVSYFYDVKVFLVNILFFMMLDGGIFFQLNGKRNSSVFILKKDGLLMSFDERFIPVNSRNKKEKMLSVNCEECKKTSHADLLNLSRGVHVFLDELDPLVLRKLEKLKET